MNINSVKYRNVENIYKSNKSEIKNIEKKKTDRVEISELGKYLNKVNFSDEKVNIEKINEIQKRIESGTYSIDSKKLAKKIINHMRGEK